MSDLLVYVETPGGVATAASRDLVAAARGLAGRGAKVVAAAIGNDKTSVPETWLGADEVVLVEPPAGFDETGDVTAHLLSRLQRELRAGLVLIPNSSVGIDLASAVAAICGAPMLASCVGLTLADETVTVRSRLYGGRAEAIANAPLPAVVAVNAGALPCAVELTAPRVSLRAFEINLPARIRVEAVETDAIGDIDIGQSDRLVCVGRGIGGEANIEFARDVARAIGGELAASRQVTDRGWVERSRQIGKSGKTVTPRLYLGLGVSGAPEHVEGMRNAGLIIAVNTDPSAPIFDIAHYGATCAVEALLPSLIRRLAESRQ
jgi:electron transfer flavoprotein alpha subunit